MAGYPIWDSDRSDEVYLQKQFESAASVTLDLLCSSSGPFELCIDGENVARGTGATVYEQPQPQRVSWTARRSGKHTLLVRATNLPTVSAPWFSCVTACDDGVATNVSWVVAPTPSALADFTEYHDARHDAREANAVVGEVVWKPVVVVAAESPTRIVEADLVVECEIAANRVVATGEWSGAWVSMDALRLQPLAECKCVHAEGILASGGARTIIQTAPPKSVVIHLDFGRTITGYPVLRLQAGNSGGIIDLEIGYREEEVHTRVRYVARKGRQLWRGGVQQSGRYVRLRFSQFSTDCHLEMFAMVNRKIAKAAAVAVETDVWKPVGAVATSTLEAVRQDVYFLQQPPQPYDWLMALTALCDDASITGHTRTARTMIATMAPVGGRVNVRLLGFPLFVESYYLLSGDTETVVNCHPDMLRVVECVARQGFMDAGNFPEVVCAALAAASTRAAASISRRLGDVSAAERCEEVLKLCSERVQAAWREDEGLYADNVGGASDCFSQWTNALVMYAGLVNSERSSILAQAMREPTVQAVADLCQAWYLCEGLWRIGAEQRALDYVDAHWGRIANRAGGTWAEKRVKQQSPYEPGPEGIFSAHLLGVRPIEPGFGVVSIRPPRTVASRASGSVPTPRGAVGVAWHRLGEGLLVEMELPSDVIARVALFRGERRRPAIAVNGATVWRNEKMYPNAFVQQIAADTEYVTLALTQAGRYHVEFA